VSSHSERNAGKGPKRNRPESRHFRRAEAPSEDWLWGRHAVEAALANPRREPPKRLLATPEQARRLEGRFGRLPALETADNATLARSLPQGAVHQGLALLAAPLEDVALAEFAAERGAVLLMLDQVTDPQNVGAILRSAAAFGARGVILQDRHAPRLTGALAKAAAGAVDIVPVARVVNLSRALETLEGQGWRAVGLDGAAQKSLAEALDGDPVVLVMGSEGEGLRPLVAEHCDVLAKIPMPGGFESLNVSAAAAIALYEAVRPRS
jgi:23S rRNA (guanosine2251-2'-O)-methyltransferase